MLESEKEIILKQKLSIEIDALNELSEEEKRKVILQFKQEKQCTGNLLPHNFILG